MVMGKKLQAASGKTFLQKDLKDAPLTTSVHRLACSVLICHVNFPKIQTQNDGLLLHLRSTDPFSQMHHVC